MEVLSLIFCSKESGNVIKSSAVTAYRMKDLNLQQSKCALGSIYIIENGCLFSYISKVKSSLCLTKVLCHEAIWWNGCIEPHFLDLSNNWRQVVSIKPWPLYTPGRKPSVFIG
jgi:hypothetical protein